MTHSPTRRWAILGVGLAAMICACATQYGMPYLVPVLRTAGVGASDRAVLVSAPITGVLLALAAWGALADRVGERVVLGGGLCLAAGALAAASACPVRSWWLVAALVAAGAASSCVHAASGRLILGWFAAHERGLAMGVRQTSQPLGLAVAALVLPPAGRHGYGTAFAVLGVGCLATGALALAAVRDPDLPRAGAAGNANPYRAPFLWRLHAASALLVLPQFMISAFAYDFLVHERGWSSGIAGTLLAGSSLAGAAARLVAGWWSDRVGLRLSPMRVLATGITITMVVLSLCAWADVAAVVGVLAVASVITSSVNGLAYTAVAERAGSRWAGRSLGIHNTGQNLVAVLTPPLVTVVVEAGSAGYPLSFAGCALAALVAVGTVPARDERPPGRDPEPVPAPVNRPVPARPPA